MAFQAGGVLSSTYPSLTTAFTPPATCTDSFAYDGVYAYATGSSLPLLQADFPQISSCFAPGWTSAVNLYAKGANFWAGTPVCPLGQTVAQTSTEGETTTAICCSSDWGDVHTNYNNFDGSTYPFYMCRTSWFAPSTTTLYGSIESGGVVVSATNVLSAPGNVQSTAEYLFVYQGQPSSTTAAAFSSLSLNKTAASSGPSGRQSPSPSSSSKKTTAASSSTTGSISAASSSSLPSSPPTHAALGPTAIALICLGTILAIGTTAAAIFFCRWRAARRRLRQQQGQGRGSGPGLWWDPITKTTMQDKPELHSQSRRVSEIQGQQHKPAGVVELPVE